MNAILWLLVLCIGAAVGMAFWSIYGFMKEVPQQDRNFQDPLPFGIQLIWPLVNLATNLLGPRLTPMQLEPAHRKLQTAGQDFVLSPEQLYGLRAVSTALVALFP